MRSKLNTIINKNKLPNMITASLTTAVVIATVWIGGVTYIMCKDNANTKLNSEDTVQEYHTVYRELSDTPSDVELNKEISLDKQKETLITCKKPGENYDVESVEINNSLVKVRFNSNLESTINDYVKSISNSVRIFSYSEIESGRYILFGIIK